VHWYFDTEVGNYLVGGTATVTALQWREWLDLEDCELPLCECKKVLTLGFFLNMMDFEIMAKNEQTAAKCRWPIFSQGALVV
jgi:hypothetical protein